MPRDLRLSLPDAPGVYRMLRTSGDVLYIGKAASLRHRVNSYFRKQTGVPERTLEMLSQARGISFDVTPTALEAALIEPGEIKQHRPPYNVALTIENRALWFAAPNLTARSPRPSSQCSLGPFPSAAMLDEFGALAVAESGALGSSRWRPDSVKRWIMGRHRVVSAPSLTSSDALLKETSDYRLARPHSAPAQLTATRHPMQPVEHQRSRISVGSRATSCATTSERRGAESHCAG
jgi:hypothetical protein